MSARRLRYGRPRNSRPYRSGNVWTPTGDDSPHFREHAALADPAVLPGRARLDRANLDGADLDGANHLATGPGAGLAGLDPAALAALVEDPAAALAQRLTAGGILALIGDPRIGPVPATCAVPGGVVEIGLPEAQVDAVVAAWAHVGVERSWIRKETPEHLVSLADYWIATYPVTNGEYAEFLRDTGHPGRPSTWYLGAYPYDRSNHPVAGIGPDEADAYAAWLTRRTGHPWRLPGEAEWEYAAKGPQGFEFPGGAQFDPAAANVRETGIHTTTPVGAFPAGRAGCGALDMGGNVEEFVADSYRAYPGGASVHDHLAATVGDYRVARGGSFARFGDLIRTRRRHGAFPGPLYPVGFRLATGTDPDRPAAGPDPEAEAQP